MQEEVDPAILQFEQAIAADPNYAPAYGNLGGNLHATDQNQKARTMFEKVLNLDPNDVRARTYLSQLE